MLNPHADAPRGTAAMPLLTAADLQDDLLTAAHDLDRLQALLAHACDALMQRFQGATRHISECTERRDLDAPAPDVLGNVMRQLSGAITALQFQDMASQLIAHTHTRLRSCADRIALEAMGGDGDGDARVEPAPLRPNPVAQDEMQAGSVELF